MVVGVAMNVGSKINDAYTFINAGLPHQVYEAVGAGVFFVAVVMLLFRWDKERQVLPTTVPSKGRAYTPAELNEIAKRKPVTGLDLVQRLEKLEEERAAAKADKQSVSESGATMKVTGTVVPAAKYSKAQINKIVEAIDAVYPAVRDIETVLRFGQGIAGSLESIIRDNGAATFLDRMDEMRLRLNAASGDLNTATEKYSLYTEVSRVVEYQKQINEQFFASYNELAGILREIPDKMSTPALKNYVDAKKSTFVSRIDDYLNWTEQKKKALSDYREWYLRRPTTD